MRAAIEFRLSGFGTFRRSFGTVATRGGGSMFFDLAGNPVAQQARI
jgi:hypothetical protein